MLLASHALPLTVAAQQRPEGEEPLQGVVVDELTGQPIVAATVSLVGTDLGAQTGRYGRFAFPTPPLGIVTVRVTAPGHPGVVQEVEVKSDRIVFIQVHLPSITAVLSDLLVRVPSDDDTGGSLTAADLLAIEAPSTRVTSGNVGRTDYALRLRGSATTLTQSQEPLVFIDGVMISRLGQALQALRQIPAVNVEVIEVLHGPAAAALYPMAANGVVLVKTRSRGGR